MAESDDREKAMTRKEQLALNARAFLGQPFEARFDEAISKSKDLIESKSRYCLKRKTLNRN
jgi:hypothetical protein